MAAFVLAISTLLQYVAAFLALRLVWVTRRRAAWILIAVAVLLMGVRRSITLSRLIAGDPTSLDAMAEAVALVISCLMVTGVALIAPVFRELTRRLKEEEERRQLELRLEHAQRLESLGVLAGGIAHDFNNLLAVIIGRAELARAHGEVPAAVREDLEDLRVAADAAAGLCRQLLAYSGRGQLQVGPLDVSEVVRRLSKLLQLSVPGGVQVELVLPEDLPLVEADASQLQQVVVNLVTNAGEAIGEAGGRIEVTTSLVSIGSEGLDGLLVGEPLAPDEYVCLKVTDSGSGMDPSTRARLFEPFFSTKFTGRGLGLAAVSGIVRAHRGAVAVRSAPGLGTTFRVLLPIPSPRIPRPAPARPSLPQGARATVLVVDDEPLVLRLAERILERAGIPVLTASSGREAIDLFRQGPAAFSLVLLDMTMPGLDGAATLLELRRIDPDAKIVFMSGYDADSLTRDRDRLAADGFVQKPFDIETLVELARRVGR